MVKEILGYIIISIISLFTVTAILVCITADPAGFKVWVLGTIIGLGMIILLYKAVEWIKGEQDK